VGPIRILHRSVEAGGGGAGILPQMMGNPARSLDRIGSCGVLPVVEIPPGTDPLALVDALVSGGIDVIEITLRTAGALDAIRAITAARPEVLVAAGTVLTIDQVDAALAGGASLIVSPGLSERVVDHAIRRGADVLPGVCTPTEVEMGLGRGLDTFKFFPAEAAGGPRYLAALGGPYPHVRFVPTGGIGASNLADYLELPTVVACGGSWMVGRKLLEASDMATVRRLAHEARAIVKQARTDRVGSSTAPPEARDA
jgi:2-dehydro-3-deoxyphosphogluconate aldolase/(4S)-4-hydroxy-2-oxoglutarate aldolase